MKVSKLDFREVLSHYGVVLARDNGDRGMAFCPFHDDTGKPNCSIDFTRNLYHCFACGAGGSIVNWVMGFEKVDYPAAVKWLSEFFSVALVTSGSADYKDIRLEADRKASFWYMHMLFVWKASKESGNLYAQNTPKPTMQQAADYGYKILLKKHQEKIDRKRYPDIWFVKDMTNSLESALVAVEDAWLARWPVAPDPRAAEWGRWVLERDVWTEVGRITERIVWRAGDLMKTGYGRNIRDGKQMLIDWLGILKAMATTGDPLVHVDAVLRTGDQHGFNHQRVGVEDVDRVGVPVAVAPEVREVGEGAEVRQPGGVDGVGLPQGGGAVVPGA